MAIAVLALIALAFLFREPLRRRRDAFVAAHAPRPSRRLEPPPLTLRPGDPALRALVRDAFIPVLDEGDAPAASKFAGVPLLRAGEAWPACGHCGEPMQLFVQLRAADVPPAAASRLDGGVMQLFYCVRDGCDEACDAWSPHARSTLVRLLAPDEALAPATSSPDGMFPARRITAWTRSDDLPNWEEQSQLGVEADDRLDPGEVPLGGDKLLGWPAWVQGVEYPSCRRCGTTMALLFQVDSEVALPWMFGDMGTGHVTQCPAHHDELAFGWACS